MHAVRLARAACPGRDKILKFEGGYHGLHDARSSQREASCSRVRRCQRSNVRSWRTRCAKSKHRQHPGRCL